MKDELYLEFVEKFRKAGSDSLQYAWERNAEQILKECQERARLSASPEPTKVGIVIEVEHTEGARAKVKVDKLFFKRTVKFCDTDFPEADIDMEQLEMDFTPGKPLEASQQGEEKPAETPRAAALLAAARELRCKAILPCLPGTIANWGRTVRSFDEKGNERLILLPAGKEREVLLQAAEMGTLVVNNENGYLMVETIDKLLRNGYRVHAYNAKGEDLGTWIWDTEKLDECHGIKLDGCLTIDESESEFLSKGDSIIACVYPQLN